MSEAITGGCMCGSVRYRLSEGLRFSLFCQCRDCQRITGSGHSALFGAGRDATTIDGAVSRYEYRADSGATMTTMTCSRCGNPIGKLSSRHPALLFLHAATLDQPERFAPTRAVWARSAQPWDALPPGLPTET